jgi:RNA-binding protein YhbY
MNKFEAKFQIGKSGITETFIETLKTAFKTHRQLRISTLASSGRDKEKIKLMASQISEELSSLGLSTAYKIIGFTIILRKQSPKDR